MTADSPLADLPRAQRLRRVVDDVLVRRAQGEVIDDDQLCRQHADLLPELASELRKLQVIAKARTRSLCDTAQAERDSVPEADMATDIRQTAAYVPRTSLSRALAIRCPLCHEPLTIHVDQALDDIGCGACGQRFSLAGDDPAWKPNQAVTKIAHFELHDRLGMGGFGSVWKATDTQLGRTVALKIPRRGQLSADEIEEFLHEARIAAKLRHPHIVSVHEIGRDGDNVYIVSDWIDGVSLARFNEDKRLTQREAAQLMATICDALHFAHEQGVVHRDLKPGNILLDRAAVPHITDFGLAKRADGLEITTDGEILGTPAYMSPEQARGESHLADRRADVYSLGVMLFELLTDYLPFRGNAAMLTEHAVHTRPPSPRSLNASISPDLETICLKCLEKDPEKRYATARELADELRRFVQGEPILARPISNLEHLARWCRRNPRMPILSGSLLAVVAIVYAVAWFWFQSLHVQSDRDLTTQALTSLSFTAHTVAHTAGRDFERYYDSVDEAARDVELRRLLGQLRADAELSQLCAALSATAVEENAAAPLRSQLEMHPGRLSVQEWIEDLTLGNDLPAFAWFVMLPDGLQIARNPVTSGGEKTIGRNYSWRAYHHGGTADRPVHWRAKPDERIRAAHLSPAFVSQFTNQWVVVISAPIQEGETFLGIIGLMLQLGSFAELPGNALDAERENEVPRFAVLYDGRGAATGQILQHPLYGELAAAPRRELLDHSQDDGLRVPAEPFVTSAHYRDPFAAVAPRYEQRWLAARQPVVVRGKETGLFVIVQESYDELIGRALGAMRRGFILLSLATLGLAAAMVIPAWVLIVRLIK